MTVYVDDMRAPLGRMILCHMLADTPEELHEMAMSIGIERRWCQFEDTDREHYDVSLGKRAMAVHAGAVEITMRQAVKIVRNRK